MISGVKAAFHMAKEKWQDQNHKYKNRDVRVLPNPHNQSREPAAGEKLPATQVSQRKITPQTVFPHMQRHDSFTSDDTDDTDSRLSIDNSNEQLHDQEPSVFASDRKLDEAAEHPLDYFQLNTGEPMTSESKQQACSTIIEQLNTHLSELKREAKPLGRKELTAQISFLQDTLASSSPDVVLEHIEQSGLKSLGEFQSALAFLIHGEMPVPTESSPASGNKSKAKVEQLMRDSLKTYQSNQINILVGDITRLREVHGLPVASIVCPYGPPLDDFSAVRDDILKAEPSLQDARLHQKLDRLHANEAFASPAVNLQSQGASHIIHQIMPRQGEGDASTQLCRSYIAAIDQARKQGLKTIAIPVLNPGIPEELACQIALTAVMYCQHNPETGGATPSVYFVFPNNKDNRNMYRAMDARLTAIPQTPAQTKASSSSMDGLPKLNMSPKETLKLMGKILPNRHGLRPKLTARKKTVWMNSEIHKACALMSQGECPLTRFEKINDYVGKAYSRMQDLAQNGKLTADQYKGLKEYLDQRVQMLEIFERKQDRIYSRRFASKKAPDYVEESGFPSCPLSIKRAMMSDFDSYSSPALQRHYLQPMTGVNGKITEVPTGKIKRPYHGVQNAGRTAVWVKALIHLYQKHGDEQAAKIREEDIPLIQMAAIFDASARKNGGPHLWEHESAEACQHALMQDGVDTDTAQQVAASIKGKNRQMGEDKGILDKILHDAVALDAMRMKETFDVDDLDFSTQFKEQLIANADAEKLANEVRSTIQRQHDLSTGVKLVRGKQDIATSPAVTSFNIGKKQEWELSPQPYMSIEEDIEANSDFISRLLLDDITIE